MATEKCERDERFKNEPRSDSDGVWRAQEAMSTPIKMCSSWVPPCPSHPPNKYRLVPMEAKPNVARADGVGPWLAMLLRSVQAWVAGSYSCMSPKVFPGIPATEKRVSLVTAPSGEIWVERLLEDQPDGVLTIGPGAQSCAQAGAAPPSRAWARHPPVLGPLLGDH